MYQLPLRLALGAAVLTAWTAPHVLAQRATQGRDPRVPAARVYVRTNEPAQLDSLRSTGRVLEEVDYSGFRMLRVELGGELTAAGLARAGHAVRTDQDALLFDGLTLDGRGPRRLLAELEPDERFGSATSRTLDPEAGLYLVQFLGPVRDDWLAALTALGIEPIQYVPWHAFVVHAEPELVSALEGHAATRPEVQFVGEYEPVFRLSPRLRQAAREGAGLPRSVTLQFVNRRGVRAAIDEVVRLARTIEGIQAVGPYVNVAAVIDPVYLSWLSARPALFGISERGERKRSSLHVADERQGQISANNATGSAPTGPGYLSWLAGHGFDATQFGTFAVNVVDDATSLTGHPDLENSRVLFGLNPSNQTGPQGGHGFLNAHIVAGFNDGAGAAVEDASGYNYGLGIAPWARVGSTAIFGPTGTDPSSYESNAYGQGARISTNSWNLVDGSQNPIPDYDASAQAFDFLTRDVQSGTAGNQEYLVIFAAGNDGTTNTVSTPSTAKNILTVGASENNRQTGTDGCGVPNTGADDLSDLAFFSSEGPVNAAGGDGRWKPELVAPGTHIQAGVPQSNFDGSSVCNASFPPGQSLYGWSSGTSHSTPAVAGGAALLYQWFLNRGMPLPSPALAKAILTGTAEYMTGAETSDSLPSNRQGLGRMQLERAFDDTPRIVIDQTQVLGSTGSSFVVAGSIADPTRPVRVVLAWTDAPGATTGAPWVNDLDLEVTVGGQMYLGNVFAGAFSTTGGSHDFRNNLEAAFFPPGTSGPFTVRVQASQIAGNGLPGNADPTDQDFALFLYNGVTSSGPVANFTAIPTVGFAPLDVSFADASTGSVTSRLWDFGDGTGSTLSDPNHTYPVPGLYDVSLMVAGPEGADTRLLTSAVDVRALPRGGITDGSFEAESPGSAPAFPWIRTGVSHVIQPAGAGGDGGFPTAGTQWASLSAASSTGGIPPSNPGGVTTPPTGGAGLSQDFTYASGQATLTFEAAFLRNENANQVEFNDWMSVDLTDGSTTVNLYYADTFTPVVGTSPALNLPITAVAVVSADLASLFPSSTPQTVFTLTAQVGNAVDSLQPSVGYVDAFQLSGPFGPPVAAFLGSPTAGSAPLTVAFSDQSTGPLTAWAWDFGDGATSSLQNPSHLFASVGTYTIALTVSGPGGTDTVTSIDHIVVGEPAPVAAFNATPTSGIAPLTVAFSDLSTGAVTAWAWDFGDGATSALQSPSHLFASVGTYTVALTVSGPGGTDTVTSIDHIVVGEPAPVAAFSATPTSGIAPLSVAFRDLSTGAVTAWAWDFGDGATSALQSPSHLFANVGTYSVALTVTGPGGAGFETKRDYVTVRIPAPVADFVGTPLSGSAPLTVAFTDLSTGAVASWAWSFGDGTTSLLAHPTHTYTTPGTYTVAFVAAGPGGSDLEAKLNYVVVGIRAPAAGFSAAPEFGTAPLTVAFTDTTLGAVTAWTWDFGDGATSSLQHPEHTYLLPGTYSVALTATGPGGTDQALGIDLVTVLEPPPMAAFAADTTEGRAPLPVAFTDLSLGSVSSWTWEFGDGASSTAVSPSHVYATPGTYDVSLTVTGPGGSDQHVQVGLVRVRRQKQTSTGVPASSVTTSARADFFSRERVGSAPFSVPFVNTSLGDWDVSVWDFGDGTASRDSHPTHVYTDPGTYTVSLEMRRGFGAASATVSRRAYIVVTAAATPAASTAPGREATLPEGALLPASSGFGPRTRAFLGTARFQASAPSPPRVEPPTMRR